MVDMVSKDLPWSQMITPLAEVYYESLELLNEFDNPIIIHL